jgi:D-alanyl-D-alanine carboxypeptidase/D-alanyl-D-alanine-endopeptidase (penicillin-binding protein 4)
MGRSGSLDHVQVDSPAAGHVYAKAGHVAGRSLGTALAGYIEPPGGERIVFSQYMERPMEPAEDPNPLWELGTEAQGEIVTAIWESVVVR